jgi:hypothetical protein
MRFQFENFENFHKQVVVIVRSCYSNDSRFLDHIRQFVRKAVLIYFSSKFDKILYKTRDKSVFLSHSVLFTPFTSCCTVRSFKFIIKVGYDFKIRLATPLTS